MRANGVASHVICWAEMQSSSPRIRAIGLWGLGLIVVSILAYCPPYFFETLANNYREIRTYNVDTANQVQAVATALASPGLRFPFNDYGHLYFNLAIAISAVYRILFPLNERAIVFILRLLSLLGGLGTIATIYVFARRYLGTIIALFAALVLGSSPLFVIYALEVKPDICQIFFIVLSLYLLARAFEPFETGKGAWGGLRADLRFLLGSAAAAGAAFGTKYQGMFLIPLLLFGAFKVPIAAQTNSLSAWPRRAFAVLCLPTGIALVLLAFLRHENILGYLLLPENSWSPALLTAVKILRMLSAVAGPILVGMALRYAATGTIPGLQTKFARRAAIVAGVGAAFMAAFALSSPWLLWHLQFIQSIYLRSQALSGGERIGLRWLWLFFGYDRPDFDYVGHLTGLLGLLGIAALLWALIRRDFRGPRLPLIFVLCVFMIFAAFLIQTVNSQGANYALLLTPLFALIAAYGLAEMSDALRRRLAPNHWRVAAVILIGTTAAAQAAEGWSYLLKYPNLFVALSAENQQIGAWYERCVPATAKILAAPYTYVPPEFQSLSVGEGYAAMTHMHPDVVTIDINRRPNFSDHRRGSEEADFAKLYDSLSDTRIWRPGPKFGPLQPYVRTNFALAAPCQQRRP